MSDKSHVWSHGPDFYRKPATTLARLQLLLLIRPPASDRAFAEWRFQLRKSLLVTFVSIEVPACNMAPTGIFEL